MSQRAFNASDFVCALCIRSMSSAVFVFSIVNTVDSYLVIHLLIVKYDWLITY